MNNIDELVAKIREICREIETIENKAQTFCNEDNLSAMLKKEYDYQKEQKILRLIELIREVTTETT